MFAYDTKIVQVMDSLERCERIHQDIDQVNMWAEKLCM